MRVFKLFIYSISTAAIIGFVGMFFLADNTKSNEDVLSNTSKLSDLPFSILIPDSIYSLPPQLSEISGITYLDSNRLLAVNDEQGIIYTYDLTHGAIVNNFQFGEKGDYEAITRNGNKAYVAMSNGNIKVIDLIGRHNIAEFDTRLSARNDVEGMCYDAKGNQLLIACKGALENEKNAHRKKGIYAFDLTKNKIHKKPYKILDVENERKHLKPHAISGGFAGNLHIDERLHLYAPSGMDIDPLTGMTYIVANRGRILLTLDKTKEVNGIYFLPTDLFGQPEGLTFDPAGNLYISNEAKSKRANIIKYIRNTSN